MDTQELDIIIQRYTQLNTEKSNWDSFYSNLSIAFLNRKLLENKQYTNAKIGKFLDEHTYSSYGQWAACTLSSILFGTIWGYGMNAITLKPIDIFSLFGEEILAEVTKYINMCNSLLKFYIERPNSNLIPTLTEYFLNLSIFGTGIIGINKTQSITTPIKFVSYSVFNVVLDQNNNHDIDTIFIKKEFNILQLVEEYGYDTLPQRLQKEYTADKFSNSKYMVIHAVYPRNEFIENTKTKKSKYKSIHFLLTEKTVLRESGFFSFPFIIGRFYKTDSEVMGRSPSMTAYPEQNNINGLSKATVKGSELQIDPPITYDETVDVENINMSAGSKIPINSYGSTSNRPPIVPLNVTGDFNSTLKLREMSREEINKLFYLDILLDFNNQFQMTAYETNLRNQLKAKIFSSFYLRQNVEFLYPFIQRCYRMLWENGLMGSFEQMDSEDKTGFVIPEFLKRFILEEELFFDIITTSSSSQLLKQDELSAIEQSIAFAIQLAQAGGLDNINIDNAIRQYISLKGLSGILLNNMEEVIQKRQIQQQMMAQQQQLELEKTKAASNQMNAQAVQSMSKSNESFVNTQQQTNNEDFLKQWLGNSQNELPTGVLNGQ